MAQNTIVMAFRKRLKSYGYTDIGIYKDAKDPRKYEVIATEPLGKTRVKAEYTTTQMYHSFR